MAFVCALIALLSLVALYVHERPLRILKPECNYQGCRLYVPLFAIVAGDPSVGALQPFACIRRLAAIVPQILRQLASIAAADFAAFAPL